MLALRMDLQIGLDTGLTVLSALLAVLFTFIALASDLLWERYRRQRQKHIGSRRRHERPHARPKFGDRFSWMSDRSRSRDGLLALSRGGSIREEGLADGHSTTAMTPPPSRGSIRSTGSPELSDGITPSPLKDNFTYFGTTVHEESNTGAPGQYGLGEANVNASRNPSVLEEGISSELSPSHHSSGTAMSEDTTLAGLHGFNSIRFVQNGSSETTFVAKCLRLFSVASLANVIKGFFWSLAITSMHYVGILALEIPSGTYTLQPGLVVLSALISWLVCFVGSVFMEHMETHLGQQLLFSALATCGVAAMHFTGR